MPCINILYDDVQLTLSQWGP